MDCLAPQCRLSLHKVMVMGMFHVLVAGGGIGGIVAALDSGLKLDPPDDEDRQGNGGTKVSRQLIVSGRDPTPSFKCEKARSIRLRFL